MTLSTTDSGRRLGARAARRPRGAGPPRGGRGRQRAAAPAALGDRPHAAELAAAAGAARDRRDRDGRALPRRRRGHRRRRRLLRPLQRRRGRVDRRHRRRLRQGRRGGGRDRARALHDPHRGGPPALAGGDPALAQRRDAAPGPRRALLHDRVRAPRHVAPVDPRADRPAAAIRRRLLRRADGGGRGARRRGHAARARARPGARGRAARAGRRRRARALHGRHHRGARAGADPRAATSCSPRCATSRRAPRSGSSSSSRRWRWARRARRRATTSPSSPCAPAASSFGLPVALPSSLSGGSASGRDRSRTADSPPSVASSGTTSAGPPRGSRRRTGRCPPSRSGPALEVGDLVGLLVGALLVAGQLVLRLALAPPPGGPGGGCRRRR